MASSNFLVIPIFFQKQIVQQNKFVIFGWTIPLNTVATTKYIISNWSNWKALM